jgi:hypothetical protein
MSGGSAARTTPDRMTQRIPVNFLMIYVSTQSRAWSWRISSAKCIDLQKRLGRLERGTYLNATNELI